MSIESERDLLALLKIGRIVGLTLREMQEALKPGITTAALDALAASIFRKHGARSAPYVTYKFPGATCISVNEEAAHGIPGNRTIRDTDLVKLDVSAELDGYFADAAVTVVMPSAPVASQQLADCAKQALDAAIASARADQPINAIGKAAERAARRGGFHIVKELAGHGIGRRLHDEPRAVPNYYVPQAKSKLTEGLVIAVEPHLTSGKGSISTDKNGWTLRARDGRPVANYEHTIVITREEPILLTAI